jgi:hypothetical protein
MIQMLGRGELNCGAWVGSVAEGFTAPAIGMGYWEEVQKSEVHGE